jgi:hypothetical protein
MMFRGFLADGFAGATTPLGAALEGARVGAGVTVCPTNNEKGALNIK